MTHRLCLLVAAAVIACSGSEMNDTGTDDSADLGASTPVLYKCLVDGAYNDPATGTRHQLLPDRPVDVVVTTDPDFEIEHELTDDQGAGWLVSIHNDASASVPPGKPFPVSVRATFDDDGNLPFELMVIAHGTFGDNIFASAQSKIPGDPARVNRLDVNCLACVGCPSP